MGPGCRRNQCRNGSSLRECSPACFTLSNGWTQCLEHYEGSGGKGWGSRTSPNCGREMAGHNHRANTPPIPQSFDSSSFVLDSPHAIPSKQTATKFGRASLRNMVDHSSYLVCSQTLPWCPCTIFTLQIRSRIVNCYAYCGIKMPPILVLFALSSFPGRGIVLTSHSMDECEALCNRLAIMSSVSQATKQAKSDVSASSPVHGAHSISFRYLSFSWT